jgi:hypothetical protein
MGIYLLPFPEFGPTNKSLPVYNIFKLISTALLFDTDVEIG